MKNQRIKIAIKAVEQASDYLVKQFQKRHDVSLKDDNTVLLGEDLKSEEILMSTISKSFPDDSFFTEETETAINSEMVWVFDPICGSYSYLRGVETWSVSLALISGDKYLLGVVSQPLLDNLYYCEAGKGVYRNNKQVFPSKTENIHDAFVSVEHGVFNSDKYNVAALIQDIKRIRVGHGSGGELAYVASGTLDAVIKTDQTLMHFAGGRALVEEAGGIFIDFTGKKAPTYFNRQQKIDYIACTPGLKNSFLDYVQK